MSFSTIKYGMSRDNLREMQKQCKAIVMKNVIKIWEEQREYFNIGFIYFLCIICLFRIISITSGTAKKKSKAKVYILLDKCSANLSSADVLPFSKVALTSETASFT